VAFSAGDRSDSLVVPAGGIPVPLAAEAIASVHTDVGEVFVHRDDTVLRPALEADGYWEQGECAFLREHLRPGSVFLDVGANVGYMTLLGARACGPDGRVIAVEPEPKNLALLAANLWRNGLEATVLPAAAYSHRGFLGLVVNEANPGDHQVHDQRGETLIPCLRLDEELDRTRVDVAKIDTQGTDHEVVAGMEGIVRRNPALVALAEFWLDGMEERGVDSELVLAGYRSHGYRLGLLDRDGNARHASDAEIIAACEAWAGRYVNVVLLGPSAPAPAGWQVHLA
jgi:FkbM family methyltransferase